MIGSFLKKADQYIKEEDFEAAERQVAQALAEDPKNIYALAYKERIRNARRMVEERRAREATDRQTQETARQQQQERFKANQPPPLTPPPSPSPQYTPPPAPSPPPQYTPPPPTEVRKMASPPRPQPIPAQPGAQRHPEVAPPLAPISALDRYRQVLLDAWQDGALTPHEETILSNMRIELAISDEEHLRLEAEIKVECYINALRNALQEGPDPATAAAMLEDLRSMFDITAEEHLQVEAKLLLHTPPAGGAAQEPARESATIFFIDDDAVLVDVVQRYLSDSGYMVMTATSPEMALHELASIIPDLIICDIRFENSPLNGLTIFERVRQMPALVGIPFIFLTGVADAELQRSSLRKGVDEYVTKPFNTGTLLAIVEGKLRRYRELRRSFR